MQQECTEKSNVIIALGEQLKAKEQECEKLKAEIKKQKEITKEQMPCLNIAEAKTMIEIEYDYAGAICNLEQRMSKIQQKISECEVKNAR